MVAAWPIGASPFARTLIAEIELGHQELIALTQSGVLPGLAVAGHGWVFLAATVMYYVLSARIPGRPVLYCIGSALPLDRTVFCWLCMGQDWSGSKLAQPLVYFGHHYRRGNGFVGTGLGVYAQRQQSPPAERELKSQSTIEVTTQSGPAEIAPGSTSGGYGRRGPPFLRSLVVHPLPGSEAAFW